jgi:hypothetical protein
MLLGLLARHIGHHLPGNPDVIVQNMPGAASLKSVLYLARRRCIDGSIIAIFNFGQIGDSRMIPEKVKIDFRKYNWIGSISQDTTICYTCSASRPWPSCSGTAPCIWVSPGLAPRATSTGKSSRGFSR